MMESSRRATGQRVKTKYFIILSQNKELLYNLIIKGLKVVFCEIDWPFLTLNFEREKSKVQYLKNIWKKLESCATPLSINAISSFSFTAILGFNAWTIQLLKCNRSSWIKIENFLQGYKVQCFEKQWESWS